MSRQINVDIDIEKVTELYLKKIDTIAEDLDWKTHFEPAEIVRLVCDIIKANPHLISQNYIPPKFKESLTS